MKLTWMSLPIASISPLWVMPVILGIMLWAGYLSWQATRRRDRFLKALCENHRDVWQAIGSPTGIHWSPPREARNQSIMYCRWAELMSDPADPPWLWQTPELAADYRRIKDDSRAWTYRRFPRLMAAILLCMAVAWVLDRCNVAP